MTTAGDLVRIAALEPTADGAAVILSTRLRTPASAVRVTWDWGDGSLDDEVCGRAVTFRSGRRHEYRHPGVYLVRTAVEDDAGAVCLELQTFVVAASPGAVSASGFICDGGSRRIAVGLFAAATADPTGPATVALRLLDGARTLTALSPGWLLVDPPAVHLGGEAIIGNAPGRHPFRVDLRIKRRHPLVTVTVYPVGGLPGRHAPQHRYHGPLVGGLLRLHP